MTKKREHDRLSVIKRRTNETEQRARRLKYYKRWIERNKLKMTEMKRQGELEQEILEDGQKHREVSRQCKRKPRISECKSNEKKTAVRKECEVDCKKSNPRLINGRH